VTVQLDSKVLRGIKERLVPLERSVRLEPRANEAAMVPTVLTVLPVPRELTVPTDVTEHRGRPELQELRARRVLPVPEETRATRVHKARRVLPELKVQLEARALRAIKVMLAVME